MKDDVVDLAGRDEIDLVRCKRCPWDVGCPDTCKRLEEAYPCGKWKQDE